jgi:hypothetical protein
MGCQGHQLMSKWDCALDEIVTLSVGLDVRLSSSKTVSEGTISCIRGSSFCDDATAILCS